MTAHVHDPRSDGATRNLLVAAGAALVLLAVCSLLLWQRVTSRRQMERPVEVAATNVPAAPAAEPKPVTGRLVVTSEPAGAQVWVHGTCVGTTPVALDALEPGEVELVLRKEGFRWAVATADVRQSATVTVDTRLAEVKGPVPARSWTVPGLGLAMTWIPTGSFLMGGADGTTNESPEHCATIGNGFWIGVYEVTQAQWEQVMDWSRVWREGRKSPEFKGTNMPIENVTWFDCVEFCRKLTEQERQACRLPDELEYRLPTEAEWEYACRAGTRTAFCFGDSLDASKANFDGRHPAGGASPGDYRKTPTPVGSFPANAWGLFDMHGNVYEWCADTLGAPSKPGRDGEGGQETDQQRVARGGSWYDYGDSCRSAYRSGVRPGEACNDVGMRLVLGVPLAGEDDGRL